MISINEYLGEINELVDALNLSRSLVSDEDIICITLERMEPKYDSFMTTITMSSSTLITYQVLQGLLTDQERHLAILNSNNVIFVNLITMKIEELIRKMIQKYANLFQKCAYCS